MSLAKEDRIPVDGSTVADAARKCLRGSPYLPLHAVECEYRWGVLILKGQLPTFYYKQLAQETVSRVQGVAEIVNAIEVS